MFGKNDKKKKDDQPKRTKDRKTFTGQAKRAYYGVFNDKKPLRRSVFIWMATIPPALGIAYALDDKPTTRAPEQPGQSEVVYSAYKEQIVNIEREAIALQEAFVNSPQDPAKLDEQPYTLPSRIILDQGLSERQKQDTAYQREEAFVKGRTNLDAQAYTLSSRIILDQGLSESQKLKLAYQFDRAADRNLDEILPTAGVRFELIERKAENLEEGTRHVARNEARVAERTAQINETAVAGAQTTTEPATPAVTSNEQINKKADAVLKESANANGFGMLNNFWIWYFIFGSGMEARARTALRNNSRKDDQLKMRDATDDLKDLLAPASKQTGPKPPGK